MYSFTQEAATHEENDIRKHGSTTFKADFKAFNLAISPRLEALLYSGEKLASITDSPLLPSQLSLQLATLSGVPPSPCFSNFLARTTFVLESLPEAKNPGQDAIFGDFVFSSSNS